MSWEGLQTEDAPAPLRGRLITMSGRKMKRNERVCLLSFAFGVYVQRASKTCNGQNLMPKHEGLTNEGSAADSGGTEYNPIQVLGERNPHDRVTTDIGCVEGLRCNDGVCADGLHGSRRLGGLSRVGGLTRELTMIMVSSHLSIGTDNPCNREDTYVIRIKGRLD